MDAPRTEGTTRTLQCPKCGLTLFEGHFTFPRCHRCNTLVHVCRYCVSHDAASGNCVEPLSAVDTVLDPDALTLCPFFKQSEVVIEAEPPLFRRGFWLYAGLAVAAVVLIVGLVQYVLLAPLRAPAEGLRAEIWLPEVLAASEARAVEITVFSQDEDTALAFRIEVPAPTAARFEILDPTPPAASREERGGAVRMTFDPVPPMKYARISLPVRAQRAGRRDFEIRVTDERGRLIAQVSRRKLEAEP